MAESYHVNGIVSDGLQSHDTRSLLDTVDSLRSQGISRYIDLPQIIVCGEQSSGKSSVLEAISGIRFPTKDNLCTRFAIELLLRCGPRAPVKISIVSGTQDAKSDDYKQQISDLSSSAVFQPLELEKTIEAAKKAMGINDSDKVFSSDILRIEVSGPDQPHLTLVDLPGLYQAGSRSQSDADSETVKSLVLRYMKNPRSIILAVVSAKNEFNNQSITRYSREIDPKGLRTLGLITKPDTLDEGSDSEKFYIQLAQNRDVKFRLGWHVVRNRDYFARDSTPQERDQVEADFFSRGVWRTLPTAQVGIHSLKPRLSNILKDQILAHLPDVVAQIDDGVKQCTQALHLLGSSRSTAQEQQKYLLDVSLAFTNLITAATDGNYFDPFFGDAATKDGYNKRLRAVLQNTLTDFAEDMRKKGQKYDIVEEGAPNGPHQILRSDYIAKVKTLLKRSRGRELPGTFDPLIIGQLFHEQRKPWSAIVEQTVEKALHAVSLVVKEALAQVADATTAQGILRTFIYPRLTKVITALRDKVSELLRLHEIGHPITYNHYLTENVQKAQAKRRAREIRKCLEHSLGADYVPSGMVNLNINVSNLLNNLVTKTEADMNNYASSTATDFMEAYYKVALKRFVDDFCVLAVESCLVEQLPTLFSPVDVLDMDKAVVRSLASEPQDSSMQRARLKEKLQVLENGLLALQGVQEYAAGRTGLSGLKGQVSQSEADDDIPDDIAMSFSPATPDLLPSTESKAKSEPDAEPEPEAEPCEPYPEEEPREPYPEEEPREPYPEEEPCEPYPEEEPCEPYSEEEPCELYPDDIAPVEDAEVPPEPVEEAVEDLSEWQGPWHRNGGGWERHSYRI